MSLVQRAEQHLQRNGRRTLEQLVLWAGYPDGERAALIASLLMPETIATWGSVTIVRTELPTIATWLSERGQLLFVEVHTHGRGRYATELSDTDRAYPIGRQAGFITVIVPGYAATGIEVARAGVWEYQPPDWVEVPTREASARLAIAADEEVRDRLRL